MEESSLNETIYCPEWSWTTNEPPKPLRCDPWTNLPKRGHGTDLPLTRRVHVCCFVYMFWWGLCGEASPKLLLNGGPGSRCFHCDKVKMCSPQLRPQPWATGGPHHAVTSTYP